MNKLFTKIATAFVGIAMAVGVGVAVGSHSDVRRAEAAISQAEEAGLELLTTSGTIDANAEYVLKSYDGYYFDGTSGSWGGITTNIDNVARLKLSGNMTDGFTIMKSSDSNYLRNSTGTFTWATTTPGTFKVTTGTLSNTTYYIVYAGTANTIKVNGTSGLRVYANATLNASTGKPVSLYKITSGGGGGGGGATNDTLTASDLKATTTTYTSFSGVTKSSSAVYLGKTAKDASGNIQINTTTTNGIATSASGGKIKTVSVSWGTTPSSGRGYTVRGSNTAYTASTFTNGTSLGTLTSSNTSLTVTGDYSFVSIVGLGGATYAASVTFSWEDSTDVAASVVGNNSVDVGTQWSGSVTEDESGDTVTGVTYAFTPSGGAVLSASSTANGTFTASHEGTVTVSATKSGYTIASKAVTVNAVATPSIILNGSTFSGYTGQAFSVTATYANLTSDFAWTTSGAGTTTESISSTGSTTDGTSTYSGTLTGAGTKVLTATGGGVQSSPTYTITITKTAFTTSPAASTSVAEGKTTTLTAALNSGGTINWVSDDTDVATVTATGTSVTVTGVAEGSATITARSADDSSVYAECEVTVTEAPSEVEITYSSYSANLPASGYAAVDWSANGITGKIYSTKHNSSYIQFQANTSYIYNSLAISGYITSISITKASGSYTQLTAFVADSDGGAITAKPDSGGVNNSTNWTWSFDAEDHYCYFRIDATSSNAKYFSDITIGYEKVQTVDPTGIVLDDDTAISMDTYGYGRRRLSATVEPFNNNDPSVTWGTSDSSVVTVADGVLTAVGVGTTTVYATTGNYVSDQATPDLKASVSVTVYQALYEKATFVPTSTSAASQTDDYLAGGSVTLSSTGSYNNDKSALQLAGGKEATFTISGYEGMKITGIDLVMSSNGNAGTGSMTVTAGTTDICEIETAGFDDATWNGAYDALPCDIYKDSTDYVVDDGEDIVFSFSATVNSLYIHSISVRYLDYSLEKWCEDFLDQITCDGSSAITDDSNWDDLGLEFLDLSEDLRGIAASATADKNSDNVIERAMARYDLILRKYGIGTGAGQHDDFIERFGEGKINGLINPIGSLIMKNSNTTIIVVVVVGIAAMAIGGYFLLRKKKED